LRSPRYESASFFSSDLSTVSLASRGGGMERHTLAVVKYLRDHPDVCDVRFSRGAPATEARLREWEVANAPCVLPDDLRAFFAQSDGMAVTWSISAGDAGVADIGHVSICALDGLTAIPLDASPPDDPWACSGAPGFPDLVAGEDDTRGVVRNRRATEAFDLGASPRVYGRVALVFIHDPSTSSTTTHTTEVWFQDLAARWHVVADSFSSYYRALHANLGLPNWHARLTDVGLDPDSEAWFHLMAPHELALDVRSGALRRTERKDRGKDRGKSFSPPPPALSDAEARTETGETTRRFGAAAAAAVGDDRRVKDRGDRARLVRHR